jgi:hypothetical protein
MPVLSIVTHCDSVTIAAEIAISTVLQQFIAEHEIVLIDSGSTNETREACQWFALDHPRRLCHSDYRNSSTGLAKGLLVTCHEAILCDGRAPVPHRIGYIHHLGRHLFDGAGSPTFPT